MALKLGEPFGLETKLVDEFDWKRATQRVSADMRSDFIFAPHLRVIFDHNSDGIISALKGRLKSGKYVAGSPITIEVPKASRIRVQAAPPRPGPNYTRPGSILLPNDRLFYQFLADNCVETIEENSNNSRSFSHRIDTVNSEKLFLPTRKCWGDFQSALRNYASNDQHNYILKIDIANFFGSVNQHTLVNNLQDKGVSKTYIQRLENVLTSFTNSRSSRGIIQGVFPSDLIGNFYLEPFDRYMGDLDFDTARYVDDVFIFVNSVSDADAVMKKLIPFLRSLDLSLNEAKSSLFPKNRLVVEEPDLEALFQDAIAEIHGQIDDHDFEVSYGFQSEWDDEENLHNENDEEIEIQATEILFDSIGDFPGHEEEIERFCLPLFLKAGSDFAVDDVKSAFRDRPSMSQIYCAYLGRFIEDNSVFDFLASQIDHHSLHEWQLMWVIGAMLQRKECPDAVVRQVARVFRDRNYHECVRAIAAIFVGRKGDRVRVDALANECANESQYVQSAIYFSSRSWPGSARTNMRAQWGNRGEMNTLISGAIENSEKLKKK